jgi:Predicted periplasmic solute-binding protein
LEFEMVDDPIAALRTHRGVLVIGDDALRLVDSGAPHLVDVGELWQRRVGLPLVYAVMAARRGVDARAAREIVRAIGASLERFRADPRELIAEVSRRIGVSGRPPAGLLWVDSLQGQRVGPEGHRGGAARVRAAPVSPHPAASAGLPAAPSPRLPGTDTLKGTASAVAAWSS